MKIFAATISILFLFSCANPAPTPHEKYESLLEEKEETIQLTYIAWGCECANWATVEDIEKYHDSGGDTLAEMSIFLEPINDSVGLSDSLSWNGVLIEFTGHFYKDKGFPKGYRSFQPVDEARVFQYSRYRVIRRNG